jgi:iron complex outermembrane receptor protein
VAIRDAFGQLTEQEVFANPLRYPNSWGTQLDIGTNTTYLAFKADNQNLGKSYSTGIDFDVTGRAKFGVGNLTSHLTLTYMVREDSQLQVNGPYFSAIGNNAELGAVTFRWQGRWTNTLKTANWAHTLGVNFKSGYKDQVTTVDRLDSAGNVIGQEDIRLDVARYVTADIQTQWTPRKDIAVTFGVLNLFDTNPPFTLSTAGVNKGQQFGYDDRYYDPRGRTVYGSLSYKF